MRLGLFQIEPFDLPNTACCKGYNGFDPSVKSVGPFLLSAQRLKLMDKISRNLREYMCRDFIDIVVRCILYPVDLHIRRKFSDGFYFFTGILTPLFTCNYILYLYAMRLMHI